MGKALNSPPAVVGSVLASVMQLRAGIDPAIAVDSHGRVKDSSWKACRNMMKDTKKFLTSLQEFQALVENGSVPARNIQAARRIRDSSGDCFRPESVRSVSIAAAGLT